MNIKYFQKKLLTWFDQYGRKHLPWRQDIDPYRVWISEIMLQQTQVQTVIPYFIRFIEEFRSVESLACASEDEVLHLWTGLGYYSRARHLKTAAMQILNTHHGKLPNKMEELISLPGIGRSTAGAILAIAYQQKATILDGNVKRLLSRLYAVATDDKTLWTIAESLTPNKRVADYTQALMDFGATLCRRIQPRCEICPFSNDCLAKQRNQVALYPPTKKKDKLPIRSVTFLIIKHNDNILLYKRDISGVWAGLYSFPEIAKKTNEKTVRKIFQENFDVSIARLEPLSPLTHTFTHFHLDIYPILLEIKNQPEKRLAHTRQIWYNLNSPEKIGLPQPVQTILRTVCGTSTASS